MAVGPAAVAVLEHGRDAAIISAPHATRLGGHRTAAAGGGSRGLVADHLSRLTGQQAILSQRC